MRCVLPRAKVQTHNRVTVIERRERQTDSEKVKEVISAAASQPALSVGRMLLDDIQCTLRGRISSIVDNSFISR